MAEHSHQAAALITCALLLAACGSSESDEQSSPGDGWTQVTVLPTPRAEVAVALLGNRAYIAGGYAGPNAFEAYDLDLGEWSTRADLPMGVDHAALAAFDGLLYLAGGGTNLLFAYDPEADSWSARANPPYDRYASAPVVIDGAIHLVGGLGPAPETMLRYEVASDAWTTLPPLSERRDHVGGVVLNDEIYALSGRKADDTNLRSMEIFDPKSSGWRPGPELKEGRSGFGYAVLDDKIYVAGGELIADPVHAQDSAEVYDPKTETWANIPSLPQTIHGCGMLSWGGRLWLFGGSAIAFSATPNDGAVFTYAP